jgi:hypothetical protein
MADSTRYSYCREPRVVRGWGALTLGLLLPPLSGLVLAARGGRLPKGERVPAHLGQLALFAALFGSPWLTNHELRADRAVLRLGLYFGGSIHYGNIDAVYATERRPTEFPMRLYRHTIFLALWPVNLVEIRLRRPQRFRVFHLLPVWRIRDVVISVDKRDDFINDLRARMDPAMERENSL